VKFLKGHLYTHTSMLDAAILVVKVQYRGSAYTKLRIEWWNQRGMSLGLGEVITIKREDLRHWREL
jgi:hypothetical protein